ncbi:hypothetical protein [Candidatus Nitrospira bockiana]
MKDALLAPLFVAAAIVAVAACSTRPDPHVAPVKMQPAVPVTVDLSRLPDGSHTIYAKDGERLIATVSEKAVTGLALKDPSDQDRPIHTIKRRARDGQGHVIEEAERLTIRPNGMVAIAPPFVPGDCALVSAGVESWWVCVRDDTIPSALPPPPEPEPVPLS